MGCRLIQGMKRVGSSEVVLGSNTAVVRGRVLGDRNSVRGRPRCLCVCRGGTSASKLHLAAGFGFAGIRQCGTLFVPVHASV